MTKNNKSSSHKSSTKKSARPQKTFPWLWVGLGALAVIAVIAYVALSGNPSPSASDSPAALPAEISVSKAYLKYEAGAFLLDVREQVEWDEKHVEGATLIPLGELQARVDELPKDQEILVICRSGNRSQEGRDILLAAGFTSVTSISGGINQWEAAGYPVLFGQ